jgi:large subunit ribosomal protein L9
LATAQAFAEKVNGLLVQIRQKAGVDGRLFGSVTNADIAEALKAQGFEVEKAAVRMPLGPIKQVGDTQVELALHTDVVAHVTVSVLGES